jgi:hypothetical protein
MTEEFIEQMEFTDGIRAKDQKSEGVRRHYFGQKVFDLNPENTAWAEVVTNYKNEKKTVIFCNCNSNYY